MLKKYKFAAVEMLKDQNVRLVLILGTLLVAMLAGGAPHEIGGGS